MINILFIHQSSELYGSDKTLLALVKNLDKSKFNPIVILPNHGLLSEEFLKENIKFYVLCVLKLHRKMFNPLTIFNLFKDAKSSLTTLKKLNKKYKFDIIYSNTLAVLLGILFAKQSKVKHIWHIHEIIQYPRIVAKIFIKLITLSANTKIAYNSKATQDFWNINEKIKSKSQIILNGVKLETYNHDIENDLNRNLFLPRSENEIMIGLIGRINHWKGHFILLEAFNELVKNNENTKLIFVGSPPPNQEFILEKLKYKIAQYNLQNKIIIIPFVKEIFKIWEVIDIAVVPSLEPEPFGLVAVEAMLSKKPVIGSNHGGLIEIIVDSETGFLVEPNNKFAIEKALQYLLNHPEKRIEFGNSGYQRAITEFSENRYVENFEKLFLSMVVK